MPKRRAPTSSSGPTRLYRVFPWLESAARGQPGHPFHLPTTQGQGRIDNPEHYSVFYASDSAAGAVAEAFVNHAVWTSDLFRVPALPGGRRALAIFSAERIAVLDLDDARALLHRRLKPSDVVTRDRLRTRLWSLAAFHEREWGGIRWWSSHDPDRGSYGLWNIAGLVVLDISPLDTNHPAVVEAARAMSRVLDPDRG